MSRWHLWDQIDEKLAVAMLQLRVRLVDGDKSQSEWQGPENRFTDSKGERERESASHFFQANGQESALNML